MKLVQIYFMGGGVMQLLLNDDTAITYQKHFHNQLQLEGSDQVSGTIANGVTADNHGFYTFAWSQVIGLMVFPVPTAPIQPPPMIPNRSGI